MAKYNLRDNNGSALIETALILPILTLMLIGAAEMGRIGYAAIEVTNAPRAAVAVGAQSTQTAQAAQTNGSMQTAATADAPDLPAVTVTPGSSCVCEAVNASTGAVNQTAISVCSGDSSTIGMVRRLTTPDGLS
jgi:Flp pilus assembly protein TadG